MYAIQVANIKRTESLWLADVLFCVELLQARLVKMYAALPYNLAAQVIHSRDTVLRTGELIAHLAGLCGAECVELEHAQRRITVSQPVYIVLKIF